LGNGILGAIRWSLSFERSVVKSLDPIDLEICRLVEAGWKAIRRMRVSIEFYKSEVTRGATEKPR
jgi:hypothetical protein